MSEWQPISSAPGNRAVAIVTAAGSLEKERKDG